MIGQVHFRWNETGQVATLQDDHAWTIEPPLPRGSDEIIESCLKVIAQQYSGPADGFYGNPQLQKAARLLKGVATLAPTKDPPDDVVF